MGFLQLGLKFGHALGGGGEPAAVLQDAGSEGFERAADFLGTCAGGGGLLFEEVQGFGLVGEDLLPNGNRGFGAGEGLAVQVKEFLADVAELPGTLVEFLHVQAAAGLAKGHLLGGDGGTGGPHKE